MLNYTTYTFKLIVSLIVPEIVKVFGKKVWNISPRCQKNLLLLYFHRVNETQFKYVYFNRMNLAQKTSMHSAAGFPLSTVPPDIRRLVADVNCDLNAWVWFFYWTSWLNALCFCLFNSHTCRLLYLYYNVVLLKVCFWHSIMTSLYDDCLFASEAKQIASSTQWLFFFWAIESTLPNGSELWVWFGLS